MVKVLVEPGDAPVRDANGVLFAGQVAHADPRWAGNGRTILNNKAKPVKQYEPFFSGSHLFEDEDDLVQAGESSVLHYDPMDRVIRKDNPNGVYSMMEYGSWQQVTSDQNDTVADSAWLAARQALPALDPERQVAQQTLAHAGTSSVVHLDTLGRTFLTIIDTGAGHLSTHVDLDIEGNTKTITDARGIVTIQSALTCSEAS